MYILIWVLNIVIMFIARWLTDMFLSYTRTQHNNIRGFYFLLLLFLWWMDEWNKLTIVRCFTTRFLSLSFNVLTLSTPQHNWI